VSAARSGSLAMAASPVTMRSTQRHGALCSGALDAGSYPHGGLGVATPNGRLFLLLFLLPLSTAILESLALAVALAGFVAAVARGAGGASLVFPRPEQRGGARGQVPEALLCPWRDDDAGRLAPPPGPPGPLSASLAKNGPGGA